MPSFVCVGCWHSKRAPAGRMRSPRARRSPAAGLKTPSAAVMAGGLRWEPCPNCGGGVKVIAAILEQPVIEKILTHLGLQPHAPPRAPARGPALQVA